MATDAEVLAAVQAAFADAPRPPVLCPCTHGDCEECADQEAFWATVDPATFTATDLERDDWGTAVTMLRSDGFRWLFPALARAALAPEGAELAEDLVTFHLRHLLDEDQPPLSVRSTTPAERRAVRAFVEHVAATAEARGVEDLLGLLPETLALWRRLAPPAGA